MSSVYLCGPIAGCTDEESRNWRELAKQYLSPLTILDPMRLAYLDGVHDPHLIVQQDLKDISLADYVLVMYDRKSVGTSMEIYVAWLLRKTIILVDKIQGTRSPWHVVHVNHFFDDLESACNFIMIDSGETR